MDSDIKKLEEKLNKYQEVKQGMMEELLTGKVRLI
jgi:type I restriction enzyme S subunit